ALQHKLLFTKYYLNPVKTLWDQLSRQAVTHNSVPHNLNDLKAALLEERDAKPQQTISLLVNSRRHAAIFSHGISSTAVGFCFSTVCQLRKSLHASI
uniref:Uncharacterized protein n=1 Tax=Poecilia reticulata TaxID=8081 RepID=A0A3P9PP09_POERE